MTDEILKPPETRKFRIRVLTITTGTDNHPIEPFWNVMLLEDDLQNEHTKSRPGTALRLSEVTQYQYQTKGIATMWRLFLLTFGVPAENIVTEYRIQTSEGTIADPQTDGSRF